MQILSIVHPAQQVGDACADIAHLLPHVEPERCLSPRVQEPGSSALSGSSSWGLVGLNHRTASIELRSQVALQGEALRGFIRTAIQSGLDECVVLSTCNRTEIYYSGGSYQALRHALAAASGVPIEQLQRHLYSSVGMCGACHLVRVASGLDSAALGETEIVAQVKQAWQIAREEGATGPMMDLLFRKALEASKRVRSQTTLCRSATSLAFLALQKVEELLGGLAGREVLVVGSGQIAERVLRELAGTGAIVTIVARNPAKAAALAQSLGISSQIYDGDHLQAELCRADAAFFCASVARPLVSREMVEQVASDRKARPAVLVDFGVPPNVDPGIASKGISLLNVDHLREVSEANEARKQESLGPALDILEQELERFAQAMIERSAAPMIRALVSGGESVKQTNLQWARERLAHLAEEDLAIVEQLATRVVRGMLERPIEHLKREPPDEGGRHLVERLFGIEEGA